MEHLLLTRYRTAIAALQRAAYALGDTAPDRGDYSQEPDRFEQIRAQHWRRESMLWSILGALELDAANIAERGFL